MSVLILGVGLIAAVLVLSVMASGLGTLLGLASLVVGPAWRAHRNRPHEAVLINGVPAAEADEWDRMLHRERQQADKIRKRYRYPVAK